MITIRFWLLGCSITSALLSSALLGAGLSASGGFSSPSGESRDLASTQAVHDRALRPLQLVHTSLNVARQVGTDRLWSQSPFESLTAFDPRAHFKIDPARDTCCGFAVGSQ